MLQQTRVAAVIDHYHRFLDRFPTITALASAKLPDVLALWSGLGYYRRARMLHAAAQQLAHTAARTSPRAQPQIPHTAAELLALPGIGAYTAAAIASIAFDQPIAAVDGNVDRVLTRLDGSALTPPQSRARAQQFLAPDQPGDFNQSMMELGATICTPRTPNCSACPLNFCCATRGEHPTTPRAALKTRSASYALIESVHRGQLQILLEQRPATAGLMPGMWELPPLPKAPSRKPVLTLRHAITSTNYRVRIFRLAARAQEPPHTRWFPIPQLSRVPITGLARKVVSAFYSPQAASTPKLLS
jgi:A/G-specific adenine glycosylase